MSDNPSSHPPKRSDPEIVALFLNHYLVREFLEKIKIPSQFQDKGYFEMDDQEKRDLFEFVFHAVFSKSGMEIADKLKRELSLTELGLIRRRVVNFLKQNGLEYDKG